MPLFYPENNQILPSDDDMRTLHKIASLNGAGSGGSSGTGSAGIQQVYYNRNPAPPLNPAFDAISFDANGVITQWIGGGSSWT